MSARRNLYVASFVAASLGYIFVSLAYSGEFHVLRWATFAAFFLVVTYAFERFIDWSETLEN